MSPTYPPANLPRIFIMASNTPLLAAQQLYAEYSYRVDNGQLARWADLFTVDAVMNIRGEDVVGRSELHKWITQNRVEGVPSPSNHIVTNLYVEVDGDVATMRSLFSMVQVVNHEAVTIALGEYKSRAQWEMDQWRIAHHHVRFSLDPLVRQPS
jgi:ketosteroid isomerase-like protein